VIGWQWTYCGSTVRIGSATVVLLDSRPQEFAHVFELGEEPHPFVVEVHEGSVEIAEAAQQIVTREVHPPALDRVQAGGHPIQQELVVARGGRTPGHRIGISMVEERGLGAHG
jgi:hypothetical protein